MTQGLQILVLTTCLDELMKLKLQLCYIFYKDHEYILLQWHGFLP